MLDHDKKISYMRIATGICDFGIAEKHLDLLVTIYEKVLVRKGKYSLDEMVDDQFEVEKRQEEKLKIKENDKPIEN